MVDQALLDRLDQLHEELKNQAILEEVAKLPQEEQLDYQIQSRIGRALGNLHQHQAAFRVLETLEDQGKDDPMWWYRMACALPHQGFQVFRTLMEKYHPKYFFHGHVHMTYGRQHKRYDKYLDTHVINAYERCVIDLDDDNPQENLR